MNEQVEFVVMRTIHDEQQTLWGIQHQLRVLLSFETDEAREAFAKSMPQGTWKDRYDPQWSPWTGTQSDYQLNVHTVVALTDRQGEPLSDRDVKHWRLAVARRKANHSAKFWHNLGICVHFCALPTKVSK